MGLYHVKFFGWKHNNYLGQLERALWNIQLHYNRAGDCC
jgi:hypothetical protein